MTAMATLMNGISGPKASKIWAGLLADESGQDLIEYALILAFIALGSVATMQGLAASLGSFFGSLGTTLTSSV
jgi:pilus assembly protein Flp/PilA